MLNGDHSSWSTVSGGVPQGSVLGPLLFLLYVNDIPLSVDSPILLFADDAKIFRSINRCEADYLQLQRDIDILFEWSRTWLLNFNISKCYVLYLGLTHSYGNYCIDGNVITSTESVKDLGIVVDSSLKFHNHTAIIVTARANRILAVINKSFEYLNTNVLLQLYKSFVRPILEYGNIIWVFFSPTSYFFILFFLIFFFTFLILYGVHSSYLISSQLKKFKEELPS